MSAPAPSASTDLQAQLANGPLAGNWMLDNERSTAAFRCKVVWGLGSVSGIFRELEAAATISRAGDIAGDLTVAAGSIDTGNRKRDTHLRSKDFLLTEKHPEITFTLSRLTPAGDGALISGTLTIRGQSRPITVPASQPP